VLTGNQQPDHSRISEFRRRNLDAGHEIYAKRKTIPEPVFGQTKEARGLQRFLLRGLAKVNGEWTLWGHP
jgi:hypothetical protein